MPLIINNYIEVEAETNTIVIDTSMELNAPPEILYNSTDFTFQCKFQGYVSEVLWYLISAFATGSYSLDIHDGPLQLLDFSQYHQSTLQATSLENYYVNKLTIINESAHFGPYSCYVSPDNSGYYYSTGSSICKLKTGTLKIILDYYTLCWFFSVALGFTYENKSYRNNSVILIHHPDNYYYYLPLISCATDNSSFYSQTNGYSEWYNPSGRRVLNLPYSDYKNIPIQQLDQCFIQYNNSRSYFFINIIVYTFGESSTGSENCSGLYQCLIPDRHGELQQLFLGIYIDNICKCL